MAARYRYIPRGQILHEFLRFGDMDTRAGIRLKFKYLKIELLNLNYEILCGALLKRRLKEKE